mmetsp:Transcript_29110/g.48126  ORF Transcript_29110/g.48126 Transcript_29110/m.48126 type:complete len:413 (-) Transcript_29110:317-1555(-)|eukprot:CAMPEP_0119015856 /NCGR_PEP_ID=MMETSP1176-20130426/11689_1 /TAXON_ID=265551 /ORGANISM="Synedropsis recta cf, Strain CCMP1620" /LENGTH=412 /DNA_ID=CAMNT_0006969179 /DNA_START=58 /DNA_END=1296 /DNA_ORIENTATION=+
MPPSRRQSNESSCDLYADVERSVHPRKSPHKPASPKRGQLKVDLSPTRRSKSALMYPNNSPNIEWFPSRRTQSPVMYPQDTLGDDGRKTSTNSESTMATTRIKVEDYEYEVSPDQAAPISCDGQQRSNRPRTSSRDCRTASSQKEGRKSITSLKESESTKVSIKDMKAESMKRSSSNKGKLQRDSSSRSQGSSTSRSSRSRSRSKSKTDREQQNRSSASLSSSFRSLSNSQNRRQRDSSSSHKKDVVRSLSPKRTDSGSGTGKPVQGLVRQHQRQSARSSGEMVWSPETGYMSRSTPDMGVIVRKSSSAHSRLNSQKGDSRRTMEKKGGSSHNKDKKEKRDSSSKVDKTPKPLTTRGWRKQMAERFGRTPATSKTMSKASSYQVIDGRRIPSTLFCEDDFAESVEDDLTVAY